MSEEERKARKREYNKAHYEANRERRLASAKAYREANREKELARKKAYREANKEKIAERNKAWREANKESISDYSRAWREANKDYCKACREVNKEKIAERSKAWREANREKVRAYKAKRRALKKKLIPKPLRECPIETDRLIKTYKLRAIISEATGVEHHVDHMWPLSDGGPHWSGNLQIITAEQNLSKSASVCEETKKIIQESLEYALQELKWRKDVRDNNTRSMQLL